MLWIVLIDKSKEFEHSINLLYRCICYLLKYKYENKTIFSVYKPILSLKAKISAQIGLYYKTHTFY